MDSDWPSGFAKCKRPERWARVAHSPLITCRLLVADLFHDPAVHVPQHVDVQPMRGGGGVHFDVEARGVEDPAVFLGEAERYDRIGDAVADHHCELAWF